MSETNYAPGAGAHSAGAPEAGKATEPRMYVSDEADRKRAEFENLIRGEYKQAFDERVQKIIDRRFRDMRVLKEQAARIRPVLDALYEKYGVLEPEELVGILKAVDARAETNDEDRRRHAVMKMMKWRADADEILRMYPGFDLANEMKNAAFVNLLKAGVDMKTAYRAVHQDEILDSAIRYAAKRAHDQTMKEIRMHASRPEENGAGGRGGAKMAPLSVGSMTRQEREEIERRCARGEKVYFS